MAPVMMMGRKVAADLACCVIRDTHCALTELFAMQIIHTTSSSSQQNRHADFSANPISLTRIYSLENSEKQLFMYAYTLL
jgi:hypothetical protein